MTTKTIRQRKDELIANINQTKQSIIARTEADRIEREFSKSAASQFEEYSNILRRNGIKNEKLIKTQIERLISERMPRDVVYANLKFLHLCRSRLTEEGFTLLDAESILTNVKFDMTGINEDDDYIGDVALAYAELAKAKFDQLNAMATSEFKLSPFDDVHPHAFAIMLIRLPE